MTVAILESSKGSRFSLVSRSEAAIRWLSSRRVVLLAMIILGGLCFDLGRHKLMPDGLSYPSYTFVFGASHYGDLGIFGDDWRLRDPYLNKSRYCGYPPFANWLIGSTYERASDKSVGEALWWTTSLLLLLYFIASVLLGPDFEGGFLRETSSVRKITLKLLSVAVIVCASYPVIFAISRGNHELGVLLLCFGFLMAFMRGSYVWAAILLGAAAAAKIHPAILALLFLYEKRTFKYAFLAGIFSIIFTVYPLYHFEGTMKENILGMIELNRIGAGPFVMGEYGTRFNACLLNGIRLAFMWLHPLTREQVKTLVSVYQVGAPAVVLILSGLSFYCFKSLWRRVAFPIVAMVLFHVNSFDYRLILLFLPISLLLITEEETDFNALIFTVLFGALMIPKDYYTIVSDSSISSIINPAILLLIMILLFVTREKRSGNGVGWSTRNRSTA